MHTPPVTAISASVLDCKTNHCACSPQANQLGGGLNQLPGIETHALKTSSTLTEQCAGRQILRRFLLHVRPKGFVRIQLRSPPVITAAV